MSGLILWERPGIEVVHLLGAVAPSPLPLSPRERGKAEGPRLFFTTAYGLRAVDARDGTDQIGWQQPAVGKLPGLGRGLLMGEWILWPTQDPLLPLRAVCQLDGSQEGTGGTYYEATQLAD